MSGPPSIDSTSPSYLRIQTITIPVTDLARSLEFYETRLGFRVINRFDAPSGVGIGLVAPPDGAAILILSDADPEERLGTSTGISLVTDDIDTRHREWSARGVRFSEPPQSLPWGARHATFFDLDGNAFRLVQADIITEQIEAERRVVADRVERERLVAYEIAIATQVQAGLFPQQRPPMTTLDYAGVCLQARQVGGDYFDFLDFGGGRLGLVIGDVSGKGLGAALLMANLQAHVRSHYAAYPDDLPALLASVNRLFQQSTPSASYATLFFGAYDDRTRRLRFVNCGHPPPVVLRDTGPVEWLDATSHALGMFEEWTGTARDIQLGEGDVVALYTDGVTEALDATGDEFGVDRLLKVLRAGDAGAQSRLDRAVAAVRDFGHGQQYDDITMVVARVRAATTGPATGGPGTSR